MKVEILECKIDTLMWYNDKIGQTYTAIKEDSQGVWVRVPEDNNTLNWIHPKECIIII